MPQKRLHHSEGGSRGRPRPQRSVWRGLPSTRGEAHSSSDGVFWPPCVCRTSSSGFASAASSFSLTASSRARAPTVVGCCAGRRRVLTACPRPPIHLPPTRLCRLRRCAWRPMRRVRSPASRPPAYCQSLAVRRFWPLLLFFSMLSSLPFSAFVFALRHIQPLTVCSLFFLPSLSSSVEPALPLPQGLRQGARVAHVAPPLPGLGQAAACVRGVLPAAQHRPAVVVQRARHYQGLVQGSGFGLWFFALFFFFVFFSCPRRCGACFLFLPCSLPWLPVLIALPTPQPPLLRL